MDGIVGFLVLPCPPVEFDDMELFDVFAGGQVAACVIAVLDPPLIYNDCACDDIPSL